MSSTVWLSNLKQMLASLKKGDRAAVMAETGAVSSGSSPFYDIGKRTNKRRADKRACVGAGRRARERLCQSAGLFAQSCGFLFLSLIIIDIVKEG